MPSKPENALPPSKQTISESDSNAVGSEPTPADPELSALVAKLTAAWPRLGAVKRGAVASIIRGLLNGD